jgi:hypothetical protein
MTHATLIAAALALSLSACMTTPAPPNAGPNPPPAMKCVAGLGAWAVGKQATAEIVERVRVDSHSDIVRVIRPGQMITMDIRADRVDVQVDTASVILAVNCG